MSYKGSQKVLASFKGLLAAQVVRTGSAQAGKEKILSTLAAADSFIELQEAFVGGQWLDHEGMFDTLVEAIYAAEEV